MYIDLYESITQRPLLKENTVTCPKCNNEFDPNSSETSHSDSHAGSFDPQSFIKSGDSVKYASKPEQMGSEYGFPLKNIDTRLKSQWYVIVEKGGVFYYTFEPSNQRELIHSFKKEYVLPVAEVTKGHRFNDFVRVTKPGILIKNDGNYLIKNKMELEFKE
jgi:hypothetical protein